MDARRGSEHLAYEDQISAAYCLLNPCRARCGSCYTCAMADRARELRLTGARLCDLYLLTKEWTTAVRNHRWTVDQFAPHPCVVCHKRRAGIRAGDILICNDCLSEPHPFYPTGAVRPHLMDMLEHAMTCTSHSSSPA